jgi:hypothetical protein
MRKRNIYARVKINIYLMQSKGPSTLAFFASVSPSAMAPPPNCFLCAITYVIAQSQLLQIIGRKILVVGAFGREI